MNEALLRETRKRGLIKGKREFQVIVQKLGANT